MAFYLKIEVILLKTWNLQTTWAGNILKYILNDWISRKGYQISTFYLIFAIIHSLPDSIDLLLFV